MDFCVYVNSMVSLLSHSGYLTPGRTGFFPGKPSCSLCMQHTRRDEIMYSVMGSAPLVICFWIFPDDFFVNWQAVKKSCAPCCMRSKRGIWLRKSLWSNLSDSPSASKLLVCILLGMYPLTCGPVTWMYLLTYKYTLSDSPSATMLCVCILLVWIHLLVAQSLGCIHLHTNTHFQTHQAPESHVYVS